MENGLAHHMRFVTQAFWYLTEIGQRMKQPERLCNRFQSLSCFLPLPSGAETVGVMQSFLISFCLRWHTLRSLLDASSGWGPQNSRGYLPLFAGLGVWRNACTFSFL